MPTLPILFALALTAPAAQLRTIPRLGDPAPKSLLKAHAQSCDVGEGHRDPCTTVRVHRDRITIAWDAATHKVTYLYSTSLVTDNEFQAHAIGPIDSSIPLVPFHTGFISSEWCDTDTPLSGDALWCAVMRPARTSRSGIVIGFVQSIYLLLPDPDAPPRRVASLQLPQAPYASR